jgi:hypothetical protein
MLPVLRSVCVRLVSRILNLLTIRSTEEFQRFTKAPLTVAGTLGTEQAPSVVDVEPLPGQGIPAADPVRCEENFTRLIRSGDFDRAWDLLTPDSQRSWQRRELFEREMEVRAPARTLVGSKVREVRFLPTWTDRESQKTYHQVAELVVDYRIRNKRLETVVTRDVHLVNISGGWKSLCYRS